MSDKTEAYLVRRIRQLLADGWAEDRIVQQLEAVAGSKKQLRELIQEVSAECLPI